MWTFGSWQFRNWNATLILIWVAELLRRSRPVEGTSDGDGGMPLQLDFLLQLLTRNNCREPPQSVLPRFQPQNVSLTSVFLPAVFYASFCCRFLAFPFPLIFNFVWLLSFLVERFVHFSSDVYIEWPNARPYFRQHSSQKKTPTHSDTFEGAWENCVSLLELFHTNQRSWHILAEIMNAKRITFNTIHWRAGRVSG